MNQAANNANERKYFFIYCIAGYYKTNQQND